MTATKGSALSDASALSLTDDAVVAVQALTGTPSSKRMKLGRVLAPGGHYAGCRLSASSTEQTPTSDVSGSANVYIHQYPGCAPVIRLYDGTNWDLYPFTTATSLSLSGSGSIPADIFAFASGGAAAFEYLSWTNDTTRATALVKQNGVWVKTGALTRLYLGTVRPVSAALNDTITQRFCWNYYNRRKRPMQVDYSKSGSTSYTTAAWRRFENTATGTVLEFVLGIVEDSMTVAIGADPAGAAGYVAVGLNTTTGTTPPVRNSAATTFFAGQTREFVPTIGYYSLNMTEFGAASFTAQTCYLNSSIMG